MTKKCSNCFQTKPVTEFYRKLDRYQARCKACNAEVARPYNTAWRLKRAYPDWTSEKRLERAKLLVSRKAGES